ncbi:RNA polymerase sigma factor [Corynebacterium sphenisci]|uniref:RNA polymerase sigma factor n=1 Tax=Corynebacterium sphenisci TaxID=191493 RepID=UPI0026DF3DE4|nr:sigma-70 family RNA polymerase sigma factor [Corynebacterium sphenisci]MDO5730491.1 sigma-70 family RNA polymerase sigma factor [Corynebacterium sphenisci]
MDRGREASLLTAAQAGDGRAFAELIAAAQDQIWGVCLSYTRNHHDAQDAMQEAITAAWQHIGRFTGRSRFSTWLHRIAVNACIDLIRRRREVLDADAGAEVAAPTTDIGDRVADGDRVHVALAQLGPEFREALLLREWSGLTYKEIAEAQGIGVQTVKSRLNRARSQMRDLLAAAEEG